MRRVSPNAISRSRGPWTAWRDSLAGGLHVPAARAVHVAAEGHARSFTRRAADAEDVGAPAHDRQAPSAFGVRIRQSRRERAFGGREADAVVLDRCEQA